MPGHQEIEIGLVKLYRATGRKKYLDMAKFFLDERGHYNGRTVHSHKASITYCQDDQPVVEQTEPHGHVVRAVYMYSGMADIAALKGVLLPEPAGLGRPQQEARPPSTASRWRRTPRRATSAFAASGKPAT